MTTQCGIAQFDPPLQLQADHHAGDSTIFPSVEQDVYAGRGPEWSAFTLGPAPRGKATAVSYTPCQSSPSFSTTEVRRSWSLSTAALQEYKTVL